MLAFLRRRAAATVAATTFCDSCAKVSTPQRRADAWYEQTRSAFLTTLGVLR